MKVWQKGAGFSFRNSDDCYGEAFNVDGAPLNLAVVTVRGKYPDSGYIYNEEAHEMAYVVSGSGTVRMKGGAPQAVNAGDVVYLPPMERFAWEGDMVLVMPCAPPFEAAKHKVEEE